MKMSDKELSMYIDRLNNKQKSLQSIGQSYFTDGMVSVDVYNHDIDTAMRRMLRNEYIAHDEVEKQERSGNERKRLQ